ncbi:hypothetical protein BBJ28_00019364 [Nothophytophthora sp. Chile5]|nr:hypothetical protein BBJ28_00019364 [Nothophytophthora sp. Chile5]
MSAVAAVSAGPEVETTEDDTVKADMTDGASGAINSDVDAEANAELAGGRGGIVAGQPSVADANESTSSAVEELAGASGALGVGEGREGEVAEDEAAAPDEAVALGRPVAGANTTSDGTPRDDGDTAGKDMPECDPGVAGDHAPGDDVAEGGEDGVDMGTMAYTNHGGCDQAVRQVVKGIVHSPYLVSRRSARRERLW